MHTDRHVTPSDDGESAGLSEASYRSLLRRLDESAQAVAARLGLDWRSATQSGADRHHKARQALVISKLGLFDEDFYLSSYPDVAAAGFDPLVHYVNLGDAEGRLPNAIFDPGFYRRQFESNRLDSVTALYHYAVLGEALGMKASSSFSAKRYLLNNTQLQAWLDHPLTHFLHLGRRQGLAVNHRARLSMAQTVRIRKERLPPPVRSIDVRQGLNLIGPLDRVSGLGVSARGYLDGLRRADFGPIGCQAQQKEFAIQSSIEGASAFPPFLPNAAVNIVHMNGDTLPVMIERGGERFLKDRYNVAVWYWELPTLRPEWQVSLNYFHEFWAPTPFIARAIEQSTGKPVRLLPPYLGYLSDLKKVDEREDADTSFVYCFDANSILERKNPSALVDAFQLAFPEKSAAKVRLTFKITYPNRKIDEVNYLYAAAARDPRIKIIDHLLSDAELHSLIGSASAYVSPHRSEGLGLTVIEAMGAGVPVICTAFGGVDTFVDESCAFPVEFDLAELKADYIPYPKEFVWANPKIGSIAEQLSSVHANPHEALKRAISAKARVLDYFSSAGLVETYKSELTRIFSYN